MTERVIMRITEHYPPEMLYHLGIITREELWALWKLEKTKTRWKTYWRVVSYS